MENESYLRLRQMIVDRELRPGEAVSERGISQLFGVGRMPVREAIRMLAQEGLLEVSPMRGTFVRQLTLGDLQEIHELRLALESAAAGLAAQRGDPAGLYAIADDLRQLAEAPHMDVAAAQQLGWRFHDEMFRMTGNLRLAHLYENLRLQSGLALQGLKDYDPSRTRVAVGEHLDIIAAITDRQADVARQKMQDHLQHAMSTRLMMLIQP
ncbi:GntR family transcriptional regulator [Martelella alba]|uniref:GntR family transcriptional regulator n=1 Tax=Martelella alba TaxID=2590451 RepID=A0ABY2SIL0_9HYPH|nr:GntR family transcriptional regulator [Martelella alba]TKI05239.1 GntR family transcriptional regulator [Martelella alba]